MTLMFFRMMNPTLTNLMRSILSLLWKLQISQIVMNHMMMVLQEVLI
uniref:Uncharacterized protein n=1 Tax=Arundo donax TaxID=35708 RepID=A0A0A9RIT0_ARUDO